jgi:tRNA nucleotidyltransferase (CCA-adding enzyme)
MDGHTLSLARGSIETRLVGDLSSARLRDELLDILAEDRLAAALERIAELGLDRAMQPRLDAGAETIALIEGAGRLMSRPPFVGAAKALVYLAALCRKMSADELYAWLGKLRLRRADQDVVAAAVTVAPLLAERLAGEDSPTPSELHELLAGQPSEVLVVAVLLAQSAEAEDRVRGYLEHIRDIELEITGDDLRQAGVPESPELGRALKETLSLKLDGFVSGREEELETALRLVGAGPNA